MTKPGRSDWRRGLALRHKKRPRMEPFLLFVNKASPIKRLPTEFHFASLVLGAFHGPVTNKLTG